MNKINFNNMMNNKYNLIKVFTNFDNLNNSNLLNFNYNFYLVLNFIFIIISY